MFSAFMPAAALMFASTPAVPEDLLKTEQDKELWACATSAIDTLFEGHEGVQAFSLGEEADMLHYAKSEYIGDKNFGAVRIVQAFYDADAKTVLFTDSSLSGTEGKGPANLRGMILMDFATNAQVLGVSPPTPINPEDGSKIATAADMATVISMFATQKKIEVSYGKCTERLSFI